MRFIRKGGRVIPIRDGVRREKVENAAMDVGMGAWAVGKVKVISKIKPSLMHQSAAIGMAKLARGAKAAGNSAGFNILKHAAHHHMKAALKIGASAARWNTFSRVGLGVAAAGAVSSTLRHKAKSEK